MWPDFTIAYTNPGWRQFAASNGGELSQSRERVLGQSVLAAISSDIRPFYETNFTRSINEGRPWMHVYECSSADVYRKYHMKVFPLSRLAGLLVINSLCVERPHTLEAVSSSQSIYANSKGLICQCSHCRRVRRGDDSSTWDWVPAWVAKVCQNISPGICPACLAHYYQSDSPAAPFEVQSV